MDRRAGSVLRGLLQAKLQHGRGRESTRLCPVEGGKSGWEGKVSRREIGIHLCAVGLPSVINESGSCFSAVGCGSEWMSMLTDIEVVAEGGEVIWVVWVEGRGNKRMSMRPGLLLSIYKGPQMAWSNLTGSVSTHPATYLPTYKHTFPSSCFLANIDRKCIRIKFIPSLSLVTSSQGG